MKLDKAKIRMPEETTVSLKKSRVSIYTEDFKGEYYNLSIDKLISFKSQARKHFDDESLKSLAATILEHGIRQPLTVIPADKEGLFEIISGERRFLAAKIAGLKQVPCIITHDKIKAEEIALIENLQREDLHPLELVDAYQSLLDKNICKSMQEIATKLGLSKSTVVETMNLKNLSQKTKDLIISNNIKSRDFFRLLNKSDSAEHPKLIKKHVDQKKSNKIKKPSSHQSKIFTVELKNDEFVINFNNKINLTQNQKEYLKELLFKYL